MMTTANALTALDRCDRCGAQAYVRTDLHGLELLWCAHHWREHGETVVQRGAVVVTDNRVLLDARDAIDGTTESSS